jgi:hypothetical protein
MPAAPAVQLIRQHLAFVESWNSGASPLTWRKSVDEILAEAVRKRRATNERRQ